MADPHYTSYGAYPYPGPILFTSEPSTIGKFHWRVVVYKDPRKGNQLAFEFQFAKTGEYWHHQSQFLTADFRQRGGPLPDDLPEIANRHAEQLAAFLPEYAQRLAPQLTLC